MRAFHEEAGQITAKKGRSLPSKEESNQRNDLMFISYESSVIGDRVPTDRHELFRRPVSSAQADPGLFDCGHRGSRVRLDAGAGRDFASSGTAADSVGHQ